MRCAADTGALLSLACSAYFHSFLEEHTLITTKEVHDELVTFSAYNDFLGQQAQKILKCVQEKKIIKEEASVFLRLKISPAELSIFSLGKEKKYFILTDDIHAARVAQQQLHLSSRPSFFLLLLLYKKKKVTKQELLLDMETIAQQRNWMNGVLYRYVKDIIESLK